MENVEKRIDRLERALTAGERQAAPYRVIWHGDPEWERPDVEIRLRWPEQMKGSEPDEH